MAFYCAGNWKMNLDNNSAQEFLSLLKSSAQAQELKNLILFPPALLAQTVASGVRGTEVTWGGQNSYYKNDGAFTGENSPLLLKTMGAKFCLVGHSERRHVFAESDDMISKKVRAIQDLDLIPLLCVGETLDDRKWNRTEEVILRQLRLGLDLADRNKKIWIAYEPVWAIGTGQVAMPEQVEQAHAMLRTGLREWNAPVVDDVPILYGGSVKPDNVKSLATLKNVDGFLVGGASLDVKQFLQIYRTAMEARV